MANKKKMKRRFRKITFDGKTHFNKVIKAGAQRYYKPICIPNGSKHGIYKDKSCEVTCLKCLEIIKNW